MSSDPANPDRCLLALKVDVDTYEGARTRVPRLLALFRELGVQASFFFCYGPDNSGKAIWNIFKRRGFLKKMIRTGALRVYGLKTALSGTLLPAPLIGQRLGELLLKVEEDGHEVGLHGWDHRLWQDRLLELPREIIEKELQQAVEAHERIFGKPPRSFAAPGWAVDSCSLRELERYSFLYTSSTRFGKPFFPIVDGKSLATLEIPSTVLCPEEIIVTSKSKNLFPEEISGEEILVYPAHAEVEGGDLLDDFGEWIRRSLSRGARCVTLEELARQILDDGSELSKREITTVEIPGRAGIVSTGYPESVGEMFKITSR